MALKKTNGLDTEESSIQQFLSVYRITPNPNTISGKSPAELMFSWKICSVFHRLLPVRKKKFTQITKILKTQKYTPKYFRLRDKVFFKVYCGAKKFWEEGVISKRVGGMMYMLKGKKYEHQRHINQLRPRYTEWH